MTEEEYWLTHGEYKGKNNPKAIKNLKKKKKSSFDTRDHFPSQSKATTEIDSGKGKKGKKTTGTNTGKNWSKGLGAASDVFGDLSKMSASPSLSGGGDIQSQGGPLKVAFRTEEYDKEAQRILKKLGNPYA